MSRYKVAIRCTSYNHAPYVEKTLEGISTQKTDFKYIAVFIDDASTDGTQGIIKNYLDDNFTSSDNSIQDYRETEEATIFIRQHKENKNCYVTLILLKYNFFQLHKSKEPLLSEWMDDAEYWAMCECDDYWIYNKKLQEEVDILDRNSDYSLVYTDYDKENYDTGEYTHALFKSGLKPIIASFEQHLVNKAYIAPMSWVCRIPMQELLNNYQGPPSIDETFIIALEIFLRSKVYYLDRVTCVYGIHSGSATKQVSLKNMYRYSYGVYATQRYYLDKYNLRVKYPSCLDYFLNAYYCFIIANRISEEYDEVNSFFQRQSYSSFMFNLFAKMIQSKLLFPLLRVICKLRLSITY